MMAFAFGLFFIPVCATVAGLVTWASTRKQSLNDGDLLRDFLVILAVCTALAWAASRTDAMRMRLDPQFRIQTELEAHPLYSTIKRLAPDDHKVLHDFLVSQMSHGRSLPEAFLQARPLLEKLTRYRLGFADQKSHLTWGRITVDTLKELQARDPVLCYRVLSSLALDQQTLAQGFSEENTKAFQQAVMEIYASADGGMRHARPSDEKPVEFNDAALEYRVIQETIVQKFGEPVSEQLARKRFPEPPVEPPEQMCSAMIMQLDAMLARPQAMASRLIDSVLR